MIPSTPTNEQRLHRAVRDALRGRCSQALDRLRVECDAHGRVTLEGEVEDWLEREHIEQIVAGVPGVVHVDCRLIVDR